MGGLSPRVCAIYHGKGPAAGWNSEGQNLSSSTVPQGAFLGNGIIGSRLLMREEQEVATPERRASVNAIVFMVNAF